MIQKYSDIGHEAATIQVIFKFTGGCRALYTCTKRFLHYGWHAEILWQYWFTGGYRALYTCTKRFLQAGWRAKTWLYHISMFFFRCGFLEPGYCWFVWIIAGMRTSFRTQSMCVTCLAMPKHHFWRLTAQWHTSKWPTYSGAPPRPHFLGIFSGSRNPRNPASKKNMLLSIVGFL